MGASRSVVADDGSRQPEGNAAERVLRFIQENPSAHLRQIKKELGLAMGTIQYQLDRLEKAGRISSTRHGLYRHYFPAGVLDNEKDVLRVLSQETAREILLLIVEKVNPTQTDISEKVMISSPSVNWHMRRLVELNLVKETKDGKYKRYSLRGDSRLIVAMLRNYYPSIWDNWSNRLAEMFLSLSRGEEET